jgi:hypothetical protein
LLVERPKPVTEKEEVAPVEESQPLNKGDMLTEEEERELAELMDD